MDNSKVGLVGVASSTRKYFEDNIGAPEEGSVVNIVGDLFGVDTEDEMLLEIIAGIAATFGLCCIFYCVQYIC